MQDKATATSPQPLDAPHTGQTSLQEVDHLVRQVSPRIAATQAPGKEDGGLGHSKEVVAKKTEVPRRSEENMKNTIKEMQTPAQLVSTKLPASAMNGQGHNQQESSDFTTYILSSCSALKLLKLDIKSMSIHFAYGKA